MRRFVLIPILAAVSAALVLSVPAMASRGPTKVESNELIRAVHRGLRVSPHEDGVELRRARISTVRPGWAASEVGLYIYPGRPFAGAFAIFHRPGDEWHLASYTEHGCGPGAGVPVPIEAQLDLNLPSCPLNGARLGEETSVRDASGTLKSRPYALMVETPTGLARLLGLGDWHTWRVNRSAETWSLGTLEGATIRVVLDGYRRCGARVTFRFLEWHAAATHEGVPARRFVLGC